MGSLGGGCGWWPTHHLLLTPTALTLPAHPLRAVGYALCFVLRVEAGRPTLPRSLLTRPVYSLLFFPSLLLDEAKDGG